MSIYCFSVCDIKGGGRGGSKVSVIMTLSVLKSVWRCPLITSKSILIKVLHTTGTVDFRLVVHYANYHVRGFMKCHRVTFKDYDSLNPHVIICIVDKQPEINGTKIALCCAVIVCHRIIDFLIGCAIGVHNPTESQSSYVYLLHI